MTVDRGASPLDKNRHQFKGLRGEQVMDEADPVEGMETASDAPLTAGQRLRAAREAAGMSLDEIATATRIPTRHLQSLEDSDFEKMPSPTYSIGFAKNYAAAVGLDRAEIGYMVRTEMGGYRPPQPIEYYEPADPSRAFPKWVVVAVLAALALVVAGFSWVKSRELDAPDAVVANEEVAANVPAPVAATWSHRLPGKEPAITVVSTRVSARIGNVGRRRAILASANACVCRCSSAASPGSAAQNAWCVWPTCSTTWTSSRVLSKAEAKSAPCPKAERASSEKSTGTRIRSNMTAQPLS